MQIKQVILSAGLTGFYFDDQKAIKREAASDGFAYRGQPCTPGFKRIRQPGESISVQLVLADGQVAIGDCAAVQYSGAGGRDPLFLADEFMPILEKEIVPLLLDRPVENFRPLAETIDQLRQPDGEYYHTAIRYGITQALLDAAALARRRTMAEVVADEYGTELKASPVPIFAQTGDDRYLGADKAIIKRVDVLPHALINDVSRKLGTRGELLLEYITWLASRIRELGGEDYHPVLHIDVYGTIGMAFDDDPRRITAYLGELEQAARPYHLRVEGPVDAGGKEAQIEALARLRDYLHRGGVDVEIVADEWCNTMEDIRHFVDARCAHMVQIKTPDLGGINNSAAAVLYAKSNGVGAYLGGTCNETDRSAQICVQVALATRPDQMLAKPGMGVDDAIMVVTNEMRRTVARLQAAGVKE